MALVRIDIEALPRITPADARAADTRTMPTAGQDVAFGDAGGIVVGVATREAVSYASTLVAVPVKNRQS